jgi:haloalkane dehalogenase
MLGVYAIASTRPAVNTQPVSEEEIRRSVADLGIEREYAFAHGFATTPHGRMHYVQSGQGRPVLLLHGSPTWSFAYRHWMRAQAVGARWIAPDLIGFGLSQKLARPSDYTLDGHIADVAALVRALDLRDVVLVVQDWGGPVGLGVLLTEPSRIAGLVVLNTFAPGAADAGRGCLKSPMWRVPLLGEQLVQGFAIAPRVCLTSELELPAAVEPQIVRSYVRVQANWSERAATLAFARTGAGVRDDVLARAHTLLQQKPIPSLIVWGGQDDLFGAEALRAWRAELPSARVVEIPQSGPLAAEDAPDASGQALSEFLRAL